MDHGIRYEEQVMNHLKQQGAIIISMKSTGSQESRFKAFLEQLNLSVLKITSHEGDEITPVFISQCLLKVDSLEINGLEQGGVKIRGIGVPDLLVISGKEVNGEKTAVIEVGDIKSSTSPRYHHKWQVAFYARLLKKIIDSHGILVRVAKTGFIITRSSGKNIQNKACFYERHEFELKAYKAAFPTVFKTFCTVLSRPAAVADHRLQSSCVSCDCFLSCYHIALESEDIQFLPGLTSGELLKLRQTGYATISQTHAAFVKTAPVKTALRKTKSVKTAFEDNDDLLDEQNNFSLEQRKQIFGNCYAFLENQIFLVKENTRPFFLLYLTRKLCWRKIIALKN
ncbi:hypothetical protein [Desulfobacula phenolica]|uniref:PD-(D/E)XK nuclease superfamily protein n=1 Tax=Desulfobacula phenolica TaxID=90732 RepID=A0A1H2GNM1_9BACT|nr:hypothetical protein [Desulfobacula phenolica]SDU20988.1 hypothetical protein SAMN04487931_105294 [Desulfobacula phenolica]